MPFQLDKWFDRASTVSESTVFDPEAQTRRELAEVSAEPLTTPSRSRASRPRGGSRGKIEGPNLGSLPCCKGGDRVQRESWHK